MLPSQQLAQFVADSKQLEALCRELGRRGATVHLKELVGGALSFYAAAAIARCGGLHIFVAEDRDAAAYLLNDFYNLLDESRICFFPSSYKRSIAYGGEDAQGVVQRTAALAALRAHDDGYTVVCTYPEALAERVADAETLRRDTIRVAVGDRTSPEVLVDALVDAGFEKVDFVYEPGQYSLRGGIVDEAAVAQAVRDGRLGGFATDVYSAEPLTPGHPFLAEDIADRIVITPHIGANTVEAQSEVSRIAAQNMLSVLRGEPYNHAVNLPFLEQALNGDQRMYLSLSRKIGLLAAKLAQVRGSAPHKCHVTLRGPLFDDEEKRLANKLRPYTIAVLKGMLEISIGTPVSYMLAPLLAKDRDISIDESYGEPRTYKNTIEVELETAKGSVSLLATITEEGRQRIVRVNDYWVDFVPTGKLLIFQNHDRPGVIGKIGSILGEAGVNIANFALGRKEGSGLALGALEIDGETDDSLNGELIKSGDMVWVATVDFTKAG